MRITTFLVVATLGALGAGCGDNSRPCTYDETDDVGNSTTAEPTNVIVGGHKQDLCGHIDNGHYDIPSSTIDVDTYRITASGSGDLVVQVTAAQGVELLTRFSVRIFDTAANPTLIAESVYDPTLAGHSAFITQLDAGDYDVVVAAQAPGDPSSPIDYRVQIEVDPTGECPALAAPADYNEAHDGDSSLGNDVVDVDYRQSPAFTLSAAADDAPEQTGITIETGRVASIAGTASMVAATAHTDEYLDRDTFAITTGQLTNELSLRLNSDSPSSDLDFIVFEADTMKPVVVSNLTSATTLEVATFAVKPKTTYWVWIGAFQGSTEVAPYTATICGGYFF